MRTRTPPLSASLTRRIAPAASASLCKPFCKALLALVRPLVFALLAFFVPPPRLARSDFALANSGEVAAVALANDAAIDDAGWIVIPFGDSRHSGKEGRIANAAERTPQQIEAERAGVIQRLDRESALALVNDYKSTWARIKRAIVGLPVFKGHPDAKRFEKIFPDKTPRGTISDMEVRETGLALKPVLTEQGAADVDAGWNKPSPYWLLREVGEEAGRKVLAPFKLLSLGLVPRGNIEGLSLVNAAESETDSTIMNEKLRKFLASIGLSGVTAPAKAADASADETALANALDTAATAVAALKSEKEAADQKVATLTADKAKLEGEKTALANAAETANGKATAAEEAAKAVRIAAAKRVVAVAVKAGKISAADSAAQETALANAADFEAEAAKLDALKPKLRTESQLGALGKDGKEQQGRTQQAIALVNAHMDSAKCDYDTAFEAVSKDPKNAALFGAMKKAETKS